MRQFVVRREIKEGKRSKAPHLLHCCNRKVLTEISGTGCVFMDGFLCSTCKIKSIIVNHSQSMKRKRFGCTDTFNLCRDVKWTGLSSASFSFSDFFVSLIKLRSRLIFLDGNNRETFIMKAPKIQRLITPSLLQRKRYFKASQTVVLIIPHHFSSWNVCAAVCLFWLSFGDAVRSMFQACSIQINLAYLEAGRP